jgi:hypothetical protein
MLADDEASEADGRTYAGYVWWQGWVRGDTTEVTRCMCLALTFYGSKSLVTTVSNRNLRWEPSEILRHVVLLEWTDVSDVHTAFIVTLMMVSVRTSETSVYSNWTARRYMPDDSHLHTRCRENLKSHNINLGRVMAQAVSHRSFTADAQVAFGQVFSCRYYSIVAVHTYTHTHTHTHSRWWPQFRDINSPHRHEQQQHEFNDKKFWK